MRDVPTEASEAHAAHKDALQVCACSQLPARSPSACLDFPANDVAVAWSRVSLRPESSPHGVRIKPLNVCPGAHLVQCIIVALRLREEVWLQASMGPAQWETFLQTTWDEALKGVLGEEWRASYTSHALAILECILRVSDALPPAQLLCGNSTGAMRTPCRAPPQRQKRCLMVYCLRMLCCYAWHCAVHRHCLAGQHAGCALWSRAW